MTLPSLREGASAWAAPAASIAMLLSLGGGLLLLSGIFCRSVAAVLGMWRIATAIIAHSNFVEINVLVHFWKNVTMAGGFAYVVALGAGVFSLDAAMFRPRTATTV